MEDLVNRRCGWAGTDDLYVKYHDEEWGKLVTADNLIRISCSGKCPGWIGLDYYSS